MAASVSSVTTMGYGNGTFAGSIALVVTLGYGIGAAAVIQPNDGWIAGTRSRLLVSDSRDRIAVSQTRNRVWIARDK